jgi:hypothetical protein
VKLYKLACANCRADFEATRSSATYCSHACRQAAYAARRRAEAAHVAELDAARLALTRRALAALLEHLERGDLGGLAAAFDALDREAAELGLPPFPRGLPPAS